MSDEDDASKTEEASERKIERAREEGDVPLSMEIKNWFMLAGGLVVIWALAPWMCRRTINFTRSFISEVHSFSLDTGGIQRLLYAISYNLAIIILPMMGLFIILAIASVFSQVGMMFSPKRLEFKWDRLNLFTNAVQMISTQKIVETIKSAFKLVIMAWVALMVIKPRVKVLVSMSDMDVIAVMILLHKLLLILIFTVTISYLLIAAADTAYQRWSFRRKLKMTKQEVKDEYKQSEGDPQVKSRIRSIRMERFRKRMMANVPRADVVVTNPTHYAIALKYEMDKMEAPMVVAKGLDFLAQRIKELAKEHEVPIVENPPLARALYATVEVDQQIPPEHFKAVAEVIGYVYRLKNKLPN